MTPFLQLIFALGIVLLFAKLAGYLSTRLGQPSVLGELLVGLILGPSVLNLVHWPLFTDAHLGEILAELGELGVLLLMFLAGLELHLTDLARNRRVAALSGTLGVVVPVLLGWGVGALAGLDQQHALYMGLALGATSVSISAQTLMEMKVLRSRVGLGLLGAAVFDDILVILLLSTFLALTGSPEGAAAGGAAASSAAASSWLQIVWIVVRMAAFLALSAAFGLWVLPALMRRVSRLNISQGVLTLALVVMLAYGLAAEVLGGMAAITGSFLAGLMFARSPEKGRIETGVSALSYSFFVPIFFVSIGLGINLRELPLSAFWLVLGVSVVAIAGKLLGCALGARLGGLPWAEALQLGTGMISRGEVGLIVASVGMKQGLIDAAVFSAVVGMVLVTTLATPPLLRLAFTRLRNPEVDSMLSSAK